MILAALALAATPAARLAEADREARQEAALARAEAPLAALTAQAATLAMRPAVTVLLDRGAAEDAIRTRALLRALAPAIAAETADLRAALVRTHAARARAAQAAAQLAEEQARLGGPAQRALNRRLAALPGPPAGMSAGAGRPVYRLPAAGRVVLGAGERLLGGHVSNGLTLATPAQATVRAPARGRVAYAGPFRGYGDIVILDHGRGWTTLLAGLDLATVGAGETVAQGAALGRMARMEPRLTIELRRRGRAIDVAGMAAQRRP